MKRFFVGALGLLAIGSLAIVGTAIYLYSGIFGAHAPLQDGLVVGPATTIVDGYTAMYSIPTDSGVLLIDAGMDADGAALQAALTAQGYALDDVLAVFLTHGHGDHIAALPLLDAPVYALSAEVELVAGRMSSDSFVGRMVGAEPTGIEVSFPMEDGAKVTVDGVNVELLAIPGHTPGSAAIVVGDTVFIGDSANAHKDGSVHGATGIFSEDLDLNHAQLAGLTARLPPEVSTVAFGHTAPTTVDALGAFRGD
jgi:glyoxylase-like metal-dependent hydrolase (beta-lactamase superfamily II)